MGNDSDGNVRMGCGCAEGVPVRNEAATKNVGDICRVSGKKDCGQVKNFVEMVVGGRADGSSFSDRGAGGSYRGAGGSYDIWF